MKLKFVFIVFVVKFGIYNSKTVDTSLINSILFPNATHSNVFSYMNSLRQLQITKTPYDKAVSCVKCSGLSVCSILNNYQIQEVYYPDNLAYLESCKVIEALGERVKNEIFGNGKTFRDTDQCKGSILVFFVKN
jgi:hypothetical protein